MLNKIDKPVNKPVSQELKELIIDIAKQNKDIVELKKLLYIDNNKIKVKMVNNN